MELNSFGLNLLDIIILIILAFYALEGYSAGFLASFFDFISFVLSFFLGLKFYRFLGLIFISYFSIPKGFANALGFFLTAFIAEIIFALVSRKIHNDIVLWTKSKKGNELWQINKLLGFLPGLASALLLISFILTIIISLPFSPLLKKTVYDSKIASTLILKTAGIEQKLNDVFGGAINETINFLTIQPQSDESISLNFRVNDLKTDQNSEEKMLKLVNKERELRGFLPLVMDEKLRNAARAHSKDMFKRGYFSHYTPEGLSPFDRMGSADISFIYAGENLALAPNVDMAMQGLMNSPGHKANILSPNFGKIGIGVMDGGIYGEMFSQEFTN